MRLRAREVDEILDALYGSLRGQLTPWEVDFIGSVQTQWRARTWLSDKQERVLLRIWEEFASGRRRQSPGSADDS